MFEFGFNGVTEYSDTIEIEELGQVCLEAIDDSDLCYYLIVRTDMGESSIVEYGPIATDFDLLPSVSNISFQRIEFNQAKIKKIISKFLSPRNKGKNKIVEVNQIDMDTALDRGVNILEYIRMFGTDSNY